MALARLKGWRTRADHPVMTATTPDAGRDEGGFTIIEMVVAMTLLALSMTALAHLMYGAMSAHTASLQRSVYLERATAEMESLRATPYDATCVSPGPSGTLPYTEFDGLEAVTQTGTPCSVVAVSPPSAADATAARIRRWVTWTNARGQRVSQGSADATLKRLTVDVEWVENGKAARSIQLTSVRYPGGFGPTGAPPGPNKPPVARATSNAPFVATIGQPITFDGSASSDDGPLGNLSYAWDFGDGTSATIAKPPAKGYSVGGRYQIRLTVRDGGGLVDAVSLDVIVTSTVTPNVAPVLRVTASCHADTVTPPVGAPANCAASAFAPLNVTFDATATTDGDVDDELVLTWNWGDGTPVEGGDGLVRPHRFDGARRYNVVVTAYDLKGGISSVTVPVRGLPLDCQILSGGLYNGNRTDEQNFIRVKNNNNQAWTNTITFTATSNTACANVKVRLPTASGQLLFSSITSTLSADGATLTWSATRTFASNTQFRVGVQSFDFIPDHPDASRPSGAFVGTFTAAPKTER